ncbi:MAG: HU family DNA-binding protein [Marinilabiliaceae bacterium]|nr:HU family DNA-binding protein [Marinilabiliaceae bacterium]
MNKTQLVEAVAAKAGSTQKLAKEVLEAFFATVSETSKKNESINITGFGSFSITERAARTGINPKTKQAIQIPAKKSVKFKAGKDLAL